MKDALDILSLLLDRARACGATQADAVLSDSSSTSISCRQGKMESIRRSEEAEIGLRILVGKRQAIVSSSDRSEEALRVMVERAVAMAKSVPEDMFAGIADPEEVAKNLPDLDLHDATEVTPERMLEYAIAAEDAGRAVRGITNSEGAEFSTGRDIVYYAATNGFSARYPSSGFSLSASFVAGTDTEMETDYDFTSAVYLSDLEAPEKVGRDAADRAVRALHPRKGATKTLPVVFEARIAGGLMGTLAGCVTGTAVARGTTFLKNKMGAQIFPSSVTVVDDPFLKRGARSRPFDGEGIAPQKRNIIDKGVLTGWLLDLSSARQLKLASTGNASRGASSPPSPRASNFYMLPGAKTPEDLIGGIEEGFLVTQLMGSGANPVTGDYSRGAKGFWIEKGAIAYPVSEMTIAGNIKDMWLDLEAANDLTLKYGVDAPTVRISRMTVAGA